MEPNQIAGALTALKEDGLLKEIYGDLAKPGVTQVGKALSSILGLGNTVLWPIQLLNDKARIKLEANLDLYRDQLKGIPVEEVVPVAPEIGVPIAEKLSYVTDNELRTMYTALLTKASLGRTQAQAHPSFVHIIDNLTPDEASLLKHLMLHHGVEPCLLVRLANPIQGVWIELADVYVAEQSGASISFPENRSAYLRNLSGLGVLNIHQEIPLSPPERYYAVEDEARLKFQNVRLLDGFTNLQLTRGKIEITRLGWMFIEACLGGKSPLDGFVPH